jgi:chitin synthase
MLLLKLNPKSHTTVNWKAQCRTSVPNTISVFLSQRRRWSLGSATHGGWMIFMPNIPIWERFSSFVFVLTYLINPFLMYSAAVWIYVLASGHGDTTYWIFTGIVQIVTVYKLMIPIWCPLSCW